MSGTLNKVMLIGHLGDDIKIHHFEGGGSIGRFPIANNEITQIKIPVKKLLIQNGTMLWLEIKLLKYVKNI